MSDKKFYIDDDLPTDPEELLELASRIYQQHLKEGENSPLHELKDVNWDEFGAMLQKAKDADAAAKEYERQAKEAEAEAERLLRETLKDKDN